MPRTLTMGLVSSALELEGAVLDPTIYTWMPQFLGENKKLEEE